MMGYPVDKAKCYLIEPYGTTQPFRTFPHTGDDWTYKKGVSSADTIATFSGTVAHVGWDPKGAGNWLILAAADGGFWVYGHHARIYTRTGQVVDEAEPLGLIGMTGFATGPHTHVMRYTDFDLALRRYIAPNGAAAKSSEKARSDWLAKSGLTNPSDHYGTTKQATKPDVPEPEPEEPDMAFNPNLYINRTSEGLTGLGVAIFNSGRVVGLTKHQWDFWQARGCKPNEVTTNGHWSYLMSQAAAERAALDIPSAVEVAQEVADELGKSIAEIKAAVTG